MLPSNRVILLYFKFLRLLSLVLRGRIKMTCLFARNQFNNFSHHDTYSISSAYAQHKIENNSVAAFADFESTDYIRLLG